MQKMQLKLHWKAIKFKMSSRQKVLRNKTVLIQVNWQEYWKDGKNHLENIIPAGKMLRLAKKYVERGKQSQVGAEVLFITFSIVLCFQCPRYEFMASKCQNNEVCIKYAGLHKTTDCKSIKRTNSEENRQVVDVNW